ncbi:MAG: c-type cytochrome [Longimicrobiales bacterium]
MVCRIQHGRSGRARVVSCLGTAALLLCAAAASAQKPGTSADSSRSAADGAYTADQATQGAAVFRNTCGNCHGTAQFKGPAFRKAWEGRAVYQLFDQLRNTMPLDNPGGLSADDYAAVLAYMLQLNEYPPGKARLPSSDSALKRITF